MPLIKDSRNSKFYYYTTRNKEVTLQRQATQSTQDALTAVAVIALLLTAAAIALNMTTVLSSVHGATFLAGIAITLMGIIIILNIKKRYDSKKGHFVGMITVKPIGVAYVVDIYNSPVWDALLDAIEDLHPGTEHEAQDFIQGTFYRDISRSVMATTAQKFVDGYITNSLHQEYSGEELDKKARSAAKMILNQYDL